ncbi:hypothetical protein ABZX34_05815 [Streptomyces sp. NPDC004362]|uniref:hypothetical protein n=1 Tax=Streptomyces sp. NPDC004362 TaxID=3154456 RepID=UPI0033AD6129
MGEQLGGDGFPGRRRVHPDGTVAGPGGAPDEAGLETALAAAVRGGDVDAGAEQRAVAAFRAARDAGAHRARTRRRDDWRVREERRVGRPLRTTFAVILASLTLGGVAVAAIGSAGSSSHGAGPGTGDKPSTGASALPGKEPSAVSPTRPGRADRPDTAKDTAAHCRAYAQVKGRGKALDSTAWQRLVTAAGGEEKVTAYCAGRLAGSKAADGPSGSGKSGAGAGQGNKGSGNGTGGSGNASGNGPAHTDQGNGKNE